jgi:hypothetical protein
LVRKLGVKPGVPAAVIGAPMDYGTLLQISDAPSPLAVGAAIPEGLAYLHLFTLQRAELEQVLTAARNRIARDGMIWVSWPKKSAKVPTDITEDVIREVCLPMGYVDVKVCAVTEVWSGLKLVIRKELR